MLVFHRHPRLFSYLLFYYIQGFVQRPHHIPADLFIEECRFFSIPYAYDDDDKSFILHYEQIELDSFTWHKYLSLSNMASSFLSCLLIFHDDLSTNDLLVDNHRLVFNSSLFDYFQRTNSIFVWTEFFCIIWFTIEFYIRFVHLSLFTVETRTWQLFVDLICIMPVLVALLARALSHWLSHLTFVYPLYICLKSFRVCRLIRDLTCFEHIRQALFLSLNKLTIGFILLSIFIMEFAFIIVIVERNDPSSNIINMNHALHWSIETLTTIGFGQFIPSTFHGRCLSILACLFGLVIVTLPVPMIFRNYQIIYMNSLKEELWRHYR
jgi:hypothetical protein